MGASSGARAPGETVGGASPGGARRAGPGRAAARRFPGAPLQRRGSCRSRPVRSLSLPAARVEIPWPRSCGESPLGAPPE